MTHSFDTKTCDEPTCGALLIMVPIRRADGTLGKPHPFDDTPQDDGHYRFDSDLAGNVVAIHDPQWKGERYRTHFASCTKPERFRRRPTQA